MLTALFFTHCGRTCTGRLYSLDQIDSPISPTFIHSHDTRSTKSFLYNSGPGRLLGSVLGPRFLLSCVLLLNQLRTEQQQQRWRRQRQWQWRWWHLSVPIAVWFSLRRLKTIFFHTLWFDSASMAIIFILARFTYSVSMLDRRSMKFVWCVRTCVLRASVHTFVLSSFACPYMLTVALNAVR